MRHLNTEILEIQRTPVANPKENLLKTDHKKKRISIHARVDDIEKRGKLQRAWWVHCNAEAEETTFSENEWSILHNRGLNVPRNSLEFIRAELKANTRKSLLRPVTLPTQPPLHNTPSKTHPIPQHPQKTPPPLLSNSLLDPPATKKPRPRNRI